MLAAVARPLTFACTLRQGGCPVPSRSVRRGGNWAACSGEATPLDPETKSRSIPRSPARPPLHWIPMHVPQLLHPLLRRPYVKVVKSRLPERPPQPFLPEDDAAAGLSAFSSVTAPEPCAASTLASRLTDSQSQAHSPADEHVPASQHIRLPQSGSERASVQESKGTGPAPARSSAKAIADNTKQ